MSLAALHAADQLDPRGDVAPLVTPADLDGALLLAEQVQKVVRLEQHVAEFGVRNSRVEACFHRLLLHHDVHGEVLAHVAKEIDQSLLDQPVGVVQDEGAPVLRVEVEQPRHLVALTVDVCSDLLLGEEGALALLTARVADHAGAAAHEDDRLVAAQLEVPQQDERHQVPDLKTGRRGVEAGVHRPRPLGHMALEVRRSVGDEPPPLEFREKVRHGAESYEKPQPLASAGAPH